MVTFKVFAGTDIGLRDNNEDNFIVSPDLTLNEWMIPANQQETIQLGKQGCLLVVADGMGGMNAGEVASDIAIKTVKEMFSPSKITDEITEKPESIMAYLKDVIVISDQRVKERSQVDISTVGMGSTIVIAWFFGSKVYVAWLGDSRAYSYIPEKGIKRLSKDHSYVQGLVDEKVLTEEEAMHHPQSNIVTRSLGDSSQKANPEVISHPIVKDEIILLCSDGLCGVCNDETISDIIKQTSEDLRDCKEALTKNALEAGGSDNITIVLLQIMDRDGDSDGEDATDENNNVSSGSSMWRNLLLGLLAFLIISTLFITGVKTCNSSVSLADSSYVSNGDESLDTFPKSIEDTIGDSMGSQENSNNSQAKSTGSRAIIDKIIKGEQVIKGGNKIENDDGQSEEETTPTISEEKGDNAPRVINLKKAEQ